MKILVLSDLHLEFAPLALIPPEVDLVVLAGDIALKQHGVAWATRQFQCPVVYVPGNHEHYGTDLGRTARKLREKAAGTNVHVLHNSTFVLNDVRIIGATLWTDFRVTGNLPLAELDAMQLMNDYKHIRNSRFGRLKPADLLREHEVSRRYLSEQLDTPFEGKTIVVSHHAPSERSIHERFRNEKTHLSASYASNLEHLMGAERVALWVHGHVHDSFDFDMYGTRVVCNPRGYAPDYVNPDFNPEMVVTV